MNGPELSPELPKINTVNKARSTEPTGSPAKANENTPVKPNLLAQAVNGFPTTRKGTPKNVADRAKAILFGEITGQDPGPNLDVPA